MALRLALTAALVLSAEARLGKKKGADDGSKGYGARYLGAGNFDRVVHAK